MVILSRTDTPLLLRIVRGQQHASDKDHEEPPPKKRCTYNPELVTSKNMATEDGPHLSDDTEMRLPPPPKQRAAKLRLNSGMEKEEQDANVEPLVDNEIRLPQPRKQKAIRLTKEEEDAIFADPLSSDDEIRMPAPHKKKTSKLLLSPQSCQEDKELRKPKKKPGRKTEELRIPALGSYAKGKADKAKYEVPTDKKSISVAASPVPAGAVTDNGFTWSMEHSSQKSSQGARSYGSRNKTLNIHRQAPKKTFGKPKGKSSIGSEKGRSWGVKASADKGEDGSESECSLKDPQEFEPDELDAVLNSCRTGTTDSESDKTKDASSQSIRRNTQHSIPNSQDYSSEGLSVPSAIFKTRKPADTGKSMLNDDELADILKAPLAHVQREDWMQNHGISSSQPNSSAPQEALDNLQDYIQQLPEEEIEGTQCTLCKDVVEMEDYWEFWKGKERTVKNHTAFCTAHKKKTARENYYKEGYPTIDWNVLPTRIRKHRTTLLRILSNQRPSSYRDRYEPLALTGKAAAVPSRRKDLPASVQEELASYALDDQSTYPGYYGPHGRRAITEHVMKVLKNEIKNCKDPVVQASGPAAFVQAVLVPEMAVMLIMEDCRVDREGAEKIRTETYSMGMLLNEEIEDVLEGQHDSDDENEYQLR